jgi:hypothetical protein
VQSARVHSHFFGRCLRSLERRLLRDSGRDLVCPLIPANASQHEYLWLGRDGGHNPDHWHVVPKRDETAATVHWGCVRLGQFRPTLLCGYGPGGSEEQVLSPMCLTPERVKALLLPQCPVKRRHGSCCCWYIHLSTTRIS